MPRLPQVGKETHTRGEERGALLESMRRGLLETSGLRRIPAGLGLSYPVRV